MAIKGKRGVIKDDTVLEQKAKDLLDIVATLDAGHVQEELCRQLTNDLMDSKTHTAAISIVTTEGTPLGLLEVFEKVHTAIKDSNSTGFVKAYCQIQIFKLVNTRIEQNPGQHPNLRRYRHAVHLLYIQELASELRPGVDARAETDTYNKLHTQYENGRKWTGICNTLGGIGVVFVLIVAGESSFLPSRITLI